MSLIDWVAARGNKAAANLLERDRRTNELRREFADSWSRVVPAWLLEELGFDASAEPVVDERGFAFVRREIFDGFGTELIVKHYRNAASEVVFRSIGWAASAASIVARDYNRDYIERDIARAYGEYVERVTERQVSHASHEGYRLVQMLDMQPDEVAAWEAMNDTAQAFLSSGVCEQAKDKMREVLGNEFAWIVRGAAHAGVMRQAMSKATDLRYAEETF